MNYEEQQDFRAVERLIKVFRLLFIATLLALMVVAAQYVRKGLVEPSARGGKPGTTDTVSNNTLSHSDTTRKE